MIIDERQNREEAMAHMVRGVMTAGRTAPKAKGTDNVEIVAVMGEDITKLADKLREEAERTGMMFFLRDADNIEKAQAVVLVGTKIETMGLNCGYCGFSTCAQKCQHQNIPCVMNDIDVGIAIGSMCSSAADMRLDSRVMFSAGYAALSMGILEECRSVFAIPLSISSKSPFFDRPSTR